MKKLIIALTAVAMAVGANAAALDWKYSTGTALCEVGTSTALAGASVYIFGFTSSANATSARNSMLQAFLTDGSFDTSSALVSPAPTTGGDGVLGVTQFTADIVEANARMYAYIAVVNGDNIFLSATKNAKGVSVGAASLGFEVGGSSSALVEYEEAAGATTTGGNWYGLASTPPEPPPGTPEPTSGLLVLLGMAGLALKRKHA